MKNALFGAFVWSFITGGGLVVCSCVCGGVRWCCGNICGGIKGNMSFIVVFLRMRVKTMHFFLSFLIGKTLPV